MASRRLRPGCGRTPPRFRYLSGISKPAVVVHFCAMTPWPIGSPRTPITLWPSASDNGVGTPDWMASQLDGWPACAPVNASAEALRPLPHDLGPERTVVEAAGR